MFNISFSLPRLFPSWGKRTAFNIPLAEIHDIENSPEKPTRALKHLLKLNHANYAVLYNDRRLHNQMPHLLSSSYLQGADADDLSRLYETESKLLDPWVDSPGEVSVEDWRDYLGCREYQRAFVNYFEDELVREGYDWKKVVEDYLFEGKEPLFNSIVADLGHPLIHLGYAFEVSSREVGMESLGLAATCYNDIHKYLDDPVYSQAEASYHSISLLEILNRVRTDKRFKGLFGTPGDDNLAKVFLTSEAALLDYWNAWTIFDGENDPVKQLRSTQELATALLLGTRTDKYDFFFVHILNLTHSIRVLLPLIPARFQLSLVRQWWLLTLAIYIAQLRPEINIDRIRKFDLERRDWKWAAQKAVKGEHSTDGHYVKGIRALRDAATTWGDPEMFYLKAAVRFAEEFNGWSGFV